MSPVRLSVWTADDSSDDNRDDSCALNSAHHTSIRPRNSLFAAVASGSVGVRGSNPLSSTYLVVLPKRWLLWSH